MVGKKPTCEGLTFRLSATSGSSGWVRYRLDTVIPAHSAIRATISGLAPDFSADLSGSCTSADADFVIRTLPHTPDNRVALDVERGPATRCDRAIGYSHLQGLGGGTQDDLVGVHVLRLLDGVGDGAGYGASIHGHVFELAGALGGLLVGDVTCELALDCPGRDGGCANLLADLLPEAFGDGPHRELGAAVDGGARRNDVTGHGREIDDLAVVLLLHLRERGGDTVQDTLDVDVHHPLPLVHLERV